MRLQEYLNLFKKNMRVYALNRRRYFLSEKKKTNGRDMRELNIEQHIRTAYTMMLKNNHKMEQIRFSVKKYRQKITIFSKSLEKDDKQIKIQFKEMVKEMKNFIKDVRNRAEIMNNQHKIVAMDAKYKNYVDRRDILHKEMTKYFMIVWEDDDFLATNLSILIKIIKFMDSEIYRKINFQSIDHLRFQHFHRYQMSLQRLMASLKNHKFQQFFAFDCINEEKQLKLIEMCLYKEYFPEEIDQLFKMQIDVRPGQSTLKIMDLIKMIKNDSSLYEKVSAIYFVRKVEKYQKILKTKFKINMYISETSSGVKKISNYNELLMILS